MDKIDKQDDFFENSGRNWIAEKKKPDLLDDRVVEDQLNKVSRLSKKQLESREVLLEDEQLRVEKPYLLNEPLEDNGQAEFKGKYSDNAIDIWNDVVPQKIDLENNVTFPKSGHNLKADVGKNNQSRNDGKNGQASALLDQLAEQLDGLNLDLD